jgi:hypothetical protein
MTADFASHLPTAVAQVPAVPVDRVSFRQITPAEFVRRYQNPGVPVILTDLLHPDWDWNLDYLCQQLDDQKFLLRFYGRDRYQQDKREWTSIGSGVKTESKSFRDYAALIRSGEARTEDIYLAKCSLQDTPLAETEAIQTVKAKLHQLGLHQSASSLNLWIGPHGHVECLHYDAMDGTLMQLHGSKRVVLFPPSQTFNLYPFPFYAHLRYGLKLRSWFSRVYPDQPDFETFPRLRQALQHRSDIILQPGELLYIPAGWWHEVTALERISSTVGPAVGPTVGPITSPAANQTANQIASPDDGMVCSVNRFWRVYPTRRAFWFWGRWRAYLGSVCAVPHTLGQLGLALLSPNRTQKIKEILQML